MLDNKNMHLSLIRADIIEGILTKTECIEYLNEYFRELKVVTDIEKMDITFELFYSCIKDSKDPIKFTEEYIKYIEDTFKCILVDKNAHWGAFCSNFLFKYMTIIEKIDVMLENKYNALTNLDYKNIPNSVVKKMFLNTYLNVLIGLSPNHLKEMKEVSKNLRKCLKEND